MVGQNGLACHELVTNQFSPVSADSSEVSLIGDCGLGCKYAGADPKRLRGTNRACSAPDIVLDRRTRGEGGSIEIVVL